MAMRNISASMIGREHLRSPQAIVATIKTLVSPSPVIKDLTELHTWKVDLTRNEQSLCRSLRISEKAKALSEDVIGRE